MRLIKYVLIICFAAFSVVSFSQTKGEEESLLASFNKIHYWRFHYNPNDTTILAPDSVIKYNIVFEKMFVKYLSATPASIINGFKPLVDSGLNIITSEDGLFRIYSWDTWTGGTMHIFDNVFQFKSGGKVNAKQFATVADSNNVDPGVFYYQVNDILSEGKKFYVTQSTARLSSRLSYHNVKIFSIENGVLNDTAKLIKTHSGIHNELGYEADRGASANMDKDVPDFYIQYDKENKIISIPVILDNGEITARRIKYKFDGKYFEKL